MSSRPGRLGLPAVLAASVSVAALAACPSPRAPAVSVPEPVAAQKPHEVPSPHGARIDPYYWLRDDTRKDPEVLAYLEAENAYTHAALAPVSSLERTLRAEMTARVAQEDASAPVFENGWWYIRRWKPERQYPILVRKRGALDAPDEVILDANERAKDHAFFNFYGTTVSPDGRYLAWTEDTVGRSQLDLRVKDLVTGELLPDTVSNITPSLAWANDSRTLFYVGKDETTLRSRYVKRHLLRTPVSADVLVHDEADGAYYTSVGETKSRRYVQIAMRSTTSNEVRLVDADDPAAPPRVFLPREPRHEYALDHDGTRFVVRTNWEAQNFRLIEVADGADPADKRTWRDVVPHDPDALVGGFDVHEAFLAWNERRGGLQRVRVLPRGAALAESFTPEANDPTFVMSLHDTPDLGARTVRWSYASLTTPSTVFELDIASRRRVVVDETPVPGYDATRYTSEYVHATAPDGAKIPVSLVRAKGTKVDGTAPALVYGYGSYGYSQDAAFSQHVVSLLDRGWVYAIAHVRGGSEMGRAWYEQGRQQHKLNSFTDFIAASEHLVATRYAARDKVFAWGGSAGGLLMGAVLNMRPDLYRGVIATVPFVDVVTTMLDASIPLTTNEYDEWGNPADKAAYEYMLSYSPYDNVGAKPYPSLLVITGLWDSQVQYFEPAKWVARLRALRTDENLLLLETDMRAGHGGKAGRFDKVDQWARRYAFFLHVLERPDWRAARGQWP